MYYKEIVHDCYGGDGSHKLVIVGNLYLEYGTTLINQTEINEFLQKK